MGTSVSPVAGQFPESVALKLTGDPLWTTASSEWESVGTGLSWWPVIHWHLLVSHGVLQSSTVEAVQPESGGLEEKGSGNWRLVPHEKVSPNQALLWSCRIISVPRYGGCPRFICLSDEWWEGWLSQPAVLLKSHTKQRYSWLNLVLREQLITKPEEEIFSVLSCRCCDLIGAPWAA